MWWWLVGGWLVGASLGFLVGWALHGAVWRAAGVTVSNAGDRPACRSVGVERGRQAARDGGRW